MAKETVIKVLKVKVTEDGLLQLAGGLDTVKKKANETSGAVDRTNKGVAGVANSTKNFSKEAQGLGGLVRAYATIAANVFALSAAYQVLKNSADLTALVESSRSLAATTGINYEGIARSLKEASQGALTFADSMRTANLASSAGISSESLERLSVVGTKAATALGRNVPDSINRLVQAVVKAEPELIDEFGIILRLEEASNKYAESIGKSANELSTFEKSQAVLNDVLEKGENKFAGITAQAKPYQQLSAEFLDVGQNIIQFLSGPITGIVSFIANNTTLITIGIITLASKITKLALPSMASFGQSLKANITDSIANSDKEIARLDRRLRALNKTMKGSVAGAQKELGNSLKEMIKKPEDLGFSKRSGISKALEKDVSGVDFLKAANTSMKPYIASLRNRTKFAIEQGASTVEFRGRNISTKLAQTLIEGYSTATVTGKKLIENSTKKGLAAGAIQFQSFIARFRIAAVRMGQDLAQGLEAGLASTSFRQLRANLKASQAENSVVSGVQAGIGGVVFAAKGLISVFSRVIPVIAGLTIAFEGFKFLAKQLGFLTDSYAEFNAALKEGTKLLDEQETILDKVIALREEGIGSETFKDQLQYVDALVNSFGTLESAGDKLIEGAEALAEATSFDRFLAFITGGGSPEKKLLEQIQRLEGRASVFRDSNDPNQEPIFKELTDAIKENTLTTKENTSGVSSMNRGAVYSAPKERVALTEEEQAKRLAEVIFSMQENFKKAREPVTRLQANFKAIEESAKNVNTNISDSVIATQDMSKAAKPLRDIQVGLAGIREISEEQGIFAAKNLNRAAAMEGFLRSLSDSSLRYFNISKATLETEEGRLAAMSAIYAEEKRLTQRVISDISNQTRQKALEAELKTLKNAESLFSGNIDLVDKRRDIEADILQTKINAERVDLNEQQRLSNNLQLGSAELAGINAQIAAKQIIISQLEEEKKLVTGIGREVEKQTILLDRASVLVDTKVEALKKEADVAEKLFEATQRGSVDNPAELKAALSLREAIAKAKELEVFQAEFELDAAKKAVKLYENKNAELMRINGVYQKTTELIKLEAEVQQKQIAVRATELDAAQELFEIEEKLFEARKKNASFSILGSREGNAEAVALFKEGMGRELDEFNRNMTTDVDRMVKALTTTTDTFVDTLVDGFAGDSSIKDSIVDAFFAGAEALRSTLADFLKEDIKQGARQIFGELFGVDTRTVDEKQLTVQEKILNVLQSKEIGTEGSVKEEKLEAAKQSKTIFEGIKQKFVEGWEKVKSIFSSVFDGFKSLFSGLFQGISSIFSSGGGSSSGGIINSIIGGLGSFITGGLGGGVDKAVVDTGTAQTFALPNTPKAIGVDFFAKGGITNGPAIAGEGKLREAVVPLPDGRTIPVNMTGSSTGEVNVYINVDVENNTTSTSSTGGESGRDYQELGRMISNAVKQEIMNQQRPGGLLA